MFPTESQRLDNEPSVSPDAVPAAASRSRCWHFGDARFDEAARTLSLAGAPVRLENRPLELLRVLLHHAGEVLSKQELIERVWPGRVVVEAVLTNAVAKLRKALGDAGPSLIETAHGIGYRLAGEVRWEWIERDAPSPRPLAPGQSLPRRANWRLQHRLGAGRSREVWQAQHVKTGELRVFKFAPDGLALPSLRREVTLTRLLQRVLGEHPGLVRVLDWDFERAPYFIELEHFGTDLLQWAEQDGRLAGLPRPQRLEIAARLADIVADAHATGVLHQDIKPENVLVHDDGQGGHIVKLADFGSGGLLDAQALASLRITHAGFEVEAPGGAADTTPLYLAPERIRGELPTTASDIYAIGVITYQLCAGALRHPMAVGWEQQIDDDLLRADLARATHGQPGERLSSARELARRLRSLPQRHAELARQREAERTAQRALEQLERERLRRPWRVAAVLALGGGLLLSGFFGWQASRARGLAQQQAANANAALQFLRDDLLAAANPRISGRARISLREALNAALPMIDQRFQGQPVVAAELDVTLAEVYHQLSDFAAAEQAWQAALSRPALATRAPAVAARAWFGLAATRARTSEIDQAQQALDRGLALTPRDDATLSLLAARTQAAVEFARNDDLAAEQTLRAALQAAAPDAPASLVEDLRVALGEVLARRGLYTDSQALLQTAVARLQAQLGARHPRTLGARHALGRALQLARREPELQALYESLVDDLRQAYGEDSEYTTLAEQGLANVYYKLQRWERQIPLAESVLAQQERRFGTRSLQTLGAAIAYSAGLLATERFGLAAEVLEKHLPAPRAAFGSGHLVVFVAELNHVAALIGSRRIAEASALLEAMRRRVPGYCTQDADCLGEMALQRGRLLALAGHDREARAALQTAIEQLSKHNPADFWTLRQAREALAQLPEG